MWLYRFTYFEENDVLFAKITPSMQNGKCAIAHDLTDSFGFGSTEFHVLRPDHRVIPEWIFYYLRRLQFRLEAKEHFLGAVGQQRVPGDFLAASLIPLPSSIDLQYRIVDRIESLLAELREAQNTLESMHQDIDQVMGAALVEIMEELRKNCPISQTIGSLISNKSLRIIGGGTPPTKDERYWGDFLPWVTPKDMKRWYIDDAEDHISKLALAKKKVKLIPRGSVLVVVRGMILARYLPVAVTATEVTINQDMKALYCDHDLLPEYLGYVLRTNATSILQQVEVAAHGTRRLETARLENVSVPLPSENLQKRIITHLDSIQEGIDALQNILREDEEMLQQVEQGILNQAFRGEL